MIKEATTPENPCADYEWLVGPYLDGELPDGEGTRLEAHLAVCSSCTTLSEQFQNLNRLARDRFQPPPRVSAEQWGAMWERIQKHKKGPASRPTRSLADWIVPVLSFAALFLLAFWLGYAILNDRGPKNREIIRGDVPELPAVEPLDTDDGYIIDFTNS